MIQTRCSKSTDQASWLTRGPSYSRRGQEKIGLVYDDPPNKAAYDLEVLLVSSSRELNYVILLAGLSFEISSSYKPNVFRFGDLAWLSEHQRDAVGRLQTFV